MTKKDVRKLSLILILGYMATLSVIPMIRAQSIALDGMVSETSWVKWISDIGNPSYNIYYTTDDSEIYIGIILEGDNPDIKFAFRADASDFLIKIVDGVLSFYPGDSGRSNWWGSKRFGLPVGVEIVSGVTEGKHSYEVKISKEMLGVYSENRPDSFPVWVMNSASDSSVHNYYPDDRDDWWFYRGSSQELVYDPEDVPTFHAPEYPLGTILSLITMMTALGIMSKRVPKL